MSAANPASGLKAEVFGYAFTPMPRQMDLLRFIAGYIEAHQGVAPTMIEMAKGVGLKSKSSANRLIDGLEERGLIRRLRCTPRAIEVIERPALPRAPDGAPLHFIPLEQLQP